MVWVGTAAGWLGAVPMLAQQPDSAVLIPAITVSATRSTVPADKLPYATVTISRARITRARPTWGLDEALAAVPGVFVANRYNFSLDQRISIRGFGSRSAFAVRGVKVLLDGIPQTLPDGQGQLTNLELGDVDHIEVLRGSASALFGNAAGGVISIWTDPAPPGAVREQARVVVGRFGRDHRTWNKWRSTTAIPLAGGGLRLTVSRLDYDGERDHSAADLRSLNSRLRLPLGPGWSLSTILDVGDDPRADNPGALTRAELEANPDSAPAINLSSHAGKDVRQLQGGVTLHRSFAAGGEAVLTVFGVTRALQNPTTFAYIDLQRRAYGARVSVSRPVPLGRFPHQLTAGVDLQRQRDDRTNFGNVAGRPDTVRTLDQLEHVTEVGPFVQSSIALTPRLTATAGLRYDWVRFAVADRLIIPGNPDDSGDRLMHALSGSFGAALHAGARVTVYGNAGSSFETPTTTELANRPDTAGGFNASLQPQQAWTLELGSRGTLGERGRWSLTLFQADVRDELISYEVPTAPQRRFYRNAGSSRHRGVEASAGFRPAPGVELDGSYTLSDFRYRSYAFSPDSTHRFVLDGHALPGIPRHWLDVRVRAAPAVARGAWIEIETRHASATLVDDTLSVRAAPWWASDVRLGWEGRVGSATWSPFIAVNNLFDRRYVGSVVINASRGRYYEPAPGRNVYMGVSVGPGR
jgi:iron complex outermembrane recepter protein